MQLMVIQDSDRLKIGEIAAQVGMELANGYKIVKVNNKSVIAEYDGHTEKFFHPTSIFYTEAVRWEFPRQLGVCGRAEGLAAIVRNFERGELAYKQYDEYGYVMPLSDATEQAGFDFAKEVQALRKSAITLVIGSGITE